jgi:Methyltransferase domain
MIGVADSGGGALMPDVYATIADADPALVTRIAEVLELRAADPQQQAMRQAYLRDIAFPQGARVLEVGCGTGAVTRELATWPEVAEVTGIDPSPTFLETARRLDPPANVRFMERDARALELKTRALMWWCSTPSCAMCPVPTWPSPRPLGSCARAAGWPSSTATTPPRPWRCTQATRYRPARRRLGRGRWRRSPGRSTSGSWSPSRSCTGGPGGRRSDRSAAATAHLDQGRRAADVGDAHCHVPALGACRVLPWRAWLTAHSRA